MSFFCASGAKDAGLFLSQCRSGQVPVPSSITCEGVFYQHYFKVPPTDTDIVKYTFTTAVVDDPLSGKKDYFIGMGSASKFDGNGLRKCGGRPPVQLVFLLDVSGSMNSRFYTRSSKQMRKKGGEESSDADTQNMTKLDAAKEALLGLLENMQEGDSFGLVSFDTRAYIDVPLEKYSKQMKERATATINSLTTRGGTDLSCGMDSAMKMLKDVYSPEDDVAHVHRRLFYLTDMQLNVGDTDCATLLKRFQTAATDTPSIYSTIIGFGVDFNVELTQSLANVRGCNYFSVHSAKEFIDQMTWEFDYLVFPIAFDIEVKIDDPTTMKTIALCGSPTPLEEMKEGTLMYCNSSFASQCLGKNREETKGGMIIVKVSPQDASKSVKLRTTYTGYDGKQYDTVDEIAFHEVKKEGEVDVPLCTSIRKGILLSRFVYLMKHFGSDVRKGPGTATSASVENGICFSNKFKESGVVDNKVMLEYLPLLQTFLKHFEGEMATLDDMELGLWKDKLKDCIEECEKVAEREKERERKEKERKEAAASTEIIA